MSLTPAQRQAAVRQRQADKLQNAEFRASECSKINLDLTLKLENSSKQLEMARKRIYKLEVALLKSKIAV